MHEETDYNPAQLNREVLAAKRRRAIALLAQGMDAVAIAERLGVHPATVRDWRFRHELGGDAALAVRKPPGRRPAR